MSVFNKRLFYVHESINGPDDCSIISTKPVLSRVMAIASYVDDKPTATENHKNLGPFSTLELESYIMTEMNEFVRALQIAGKCTTNPDSGCSSYFSGKQNNLYPLYKIPIPMGLDAEKYVLKNRKQLCWRSFELLVLLLTFDVILTKLKTIDLGDPDIKTLRDLHKSNTDLRTAIQTQVQDLKEGQNGLSDALKTSNERLNITIYTSVLWTILATTLVVYWVKDS